MVWSKTIAMKVVRAGGGRPNESVLPPSAQPSVGDHLPDDVRELLESGAEVHFIPIPADRSATLAKSAVSAIAESFGVELDMGVTFMPNGILVIGPPKRL